MGIPEAPRAPPPAPTEVPPPGDPSLGDSGTLTPWGIFEGVADSRDVFDKIMEKASMSSITTRGSESSSLIPGLLWDLRSFSKQTEGQRLAQLGSQKLVDGHPSWAHRS